MKNEMVICFMGNNSVDFTTYSSTNTSGYINENMKTSIKYGLLC